MLRSISIQNYALIEKAYIEFHQGFSVITGETGAGKSILLGALGLILGDRADQKAIKESHKKCVIEGEFDVKNIKLKHFFLSNDLDYEDNTILRREISSSGKSRAFINDSPVSLNILKELAERLVNIHSQHQTLNLGKFDFQLNALDAFINEPIILNEYQQYYGSYKKLNKHVIEIKDKNQKLKKDEDYLKFQLNELESVSLEKEIIEQLIDREQLLSNAEEIASGIELSKELLDENDISANQILNELSLTLNKLSNYHSSIKLLAERIASVHIEIKDISSEINAISSDIEFDPQELQDIKYKLDMYYGLQQKHHLKTIEELISLKEEISAKLKSIDLIDDSVKEAELALLENKKQIEKIAKQLHSQRNAYAQKMSAEVKSLLMQLGMKNAEFNIVVEKIDDFNSTGLDQVTFLFNANKGGRPEQISKVASGGELSRLMLAIKSLINRRNILPTVIFDEIDAGVSGEIAGKVGTILKKMSDKHQVIAITHLPQIASKANFHYNVFKTENLNSTSTQIEMLDDNGRLEAIAKMLSDKNVTDTSMKAAEELLK